MSVTRRKTHTVSIGKIPLGSDYPIRIQSMTTVDTMDTEGSVAQILKMVASGCEYVRLTAPSLKEAENLKNIKNLLQEKGCHVPLIADIHFTPNAAEKAAGIVEKVRINPGNYADKKKFENLDFSESAYQGELERIEKKLIPLIEKCKKNNTVLRIGTNHGSLSDRIMSRYGDTPLGMVESALEYIRIGEKLDFFDVVVSMKSSNPKVMIAAYRLLVQKLEEENLRSYPLHLGVTEAGESEDGRIKSAIGIGTLLEEGIGDTIRVSLTEPPEVEAPVAKILVDRIKIKNEFDSSEAFPYPAIFENKRNTCEVANIGGANVPRVVVDFSKISLHSKKQLKDIGYSYLPELDKWGMNDFAADFIYTGSRRATFELPNGLGEIMDFQNGIPFQKNQFPLFTFPQWQEQIGHQHPQLNFVKINTEEKLDFHLLKNAQNVVWVVSTKASHSMYNFKNFFHELRKKGIENPVILQRSYVGLSQEELMMYAATDFGGMLIENEGAGIFLESDHRDVAFLNSIQFGILQAARCRISKAEFISCPSCGRTLFDLQETTAKIRKFTHHLKGIKIGIMGCIVNGPGEMADADYGYVGSGKDKISLYKGKEIVKKNVPSSQALDALIDLIKDDGKWINPEMET